MITLRLLIFSLLLVSFGGVKAQADTLDRKKHIVKVNYNLRLSYIDYIEYNSYSSDNGAMVYSERRFRESILSSFPTISYLRLTKNSNFLELELRNVELNRVQPNSKNITSQTTDTFESGVSVRSSMSYNLLSSNHRFFTLGLFGGILNSNSKNYVSNSKYNQLVFDIGPILKYSLLTKKSIYAEIGINAKAFTYRWNRLKNNAPTSSNRNIEYRNSFDNYFNFNQVGRTDLYKNLDLSFSIGYNFRSK